jgi:pimeloyl-ACP methyl ester carboxylesterase
MLIALRGKKYLYWCLALALLLLGLCGTTVVGARPAAEQCNWSPRQMELGEGTVAYAQLGVGEPVLLLHGLFANKEQWQPLACQLSQLGYQAIVPDLPGYGQSTGFSISHYALANQAQLLHQFSGQLGLGRLNLAGSSMGGAIAYLYSQLYPQEVKSLAFLGAPLGVVPWSGQIRAAIIAGINPFIPITESEFDLEISLLFVTPPTIAPEVKKAKVEDYVSNNHRYQQIWNIVNLDDQLLQAKNLLQPLPLLTIWGEADQIYDLKAAQSLTSPLQTGPWVTLARAGHLLILENSAETAAIYSHFLKGHSGRGLSLSKTDKLVKPR